MNLPTTFLCQFLRFFFVALVVNITVLASILFDSIWVVLAWDLAVCSSQGLRFDSPWCQSWWASPYMALLWV